MTETTFSQIQAEKYTDLISRSALLADIEDTVVISARNTISTEMRGIRKVVDRIEAANQNFIFRSSHVCFVVHKKYPPKTNVLVFFS